MAGRYTGSTSKPPLCLRVMKFCEKSNARGMRLQELMNFEELSRFSEIINLLIIELNHQREMLTLFAEIIEYVHGNDDALGPTSRVGETSGTRNIIEKSEHDLSKLFEEMSIMPRVEFERAEEFAKKIKNLMHEELGNEYCMEDRLLWKNWKDFQEMKTKILDEETEFLSHLVDKVRPLMAINVKLVRKFKVLREKLMSWVETEWIFKASKCFFDSLENINSIDTHVLAYMSTSSKGGFLSLSCHRKICADLADMLL